MSEVDQVMEVESEVMRMTVQIRHTVQMNTSEC